MARHLGRVFPHLPAETLALRLDELVRFLQISASLGAGHVPISKELDELWHAYILETKDYASLCETIGSFIHHTAIAEPMADDRRQAIADRQMMNMRFVAAYISRFGAFRPEARPLWPMLAELCAYLSMTTDQLMQAAVEMQSR